MLAHRRGQTLLEMIIGIGVITVATFATATLIVSTIRTGRVSQARIEAADLAREGVEIVRGIRDSNWLKADQNAVENDGTTVVWNSYRDGLGYYPMNGKYTALFVPTTGQWTLQTTAAASCVLSDATTLVYQKTQTVSGSPTTFYTQQNPCNGCTATNYHRIIVVTPLQDNVTFPGAGSATPIDYLSVVSTVCGNALTGPSKSIVASARLYNWK